MFSPSDPRLTADHRDVLELLAAGNSLSEAAALRGVSMKAVDGMLTTIRRRLEAKNTVEAVAAALLADQLDRAAIVAHRTARAFRRPRKRKAG